MSSPLDKFLPAFDARERFAVSVHAPAALVYQVARQFDPHSLFLVRAIFRLREKLMRATPVARKPQGFIDETLALGWGVSSSAQESCSWPERGVSPGWRMSCSRRSPLASSRPSRNRAR